MIAKLMTILGTSEAETNFTGADSMSRRAYPRRTADKCVGLVNGQAMPVIDWSPGGLKILGDTRPYALGQQLDVNLKFHLANQLIDVKHQAQVVRKGAETFSVQFAPLNAEIRKAFQHVIDAFNADEFAASQA